MIEWWGQRHDMPDILAQAIRQLLDDRDLRERMGKAGRARAEAEFGTELVVAHTLAVYDELTARIPVVRER
jgi:glycosyltransferase involved in cell wall biosynthesis